MRLGDLIPKKIKDLLMENRKYSYGCVMLEFHFEELEQIHELIDENDIFIDENDPSFGLEKDPHTTLLYGLHEEVGLNEVEKVLESYTFTTVKAHNPSLFENEKFDVLKFDVSGECLHEVNGDLKNYPHTSSFPDYHPHLTIAYLKSGTGKKYVEIIGETFDKEFWLAPQNAKFSHPNGTKSKLNIRID